jgi:hypothetical protein
MSFGGAGSVTVSNTPAAPQLSQALRNKRAMTLGRTAPTNSGVFDTPQRFEQTMINTNQHNGGVVAATRPTAEGDDAEEFRQRLATVARMLYLSAGNRCTDAQRQLLQDGYRRVRDN